MKTKLTILGITICAIIIGYSGMRCGVNSECVLFSQLHQFSFSVLKPIWVFALFSLPLAIAIMFVSEQTLKSWSRLAVFFVALSIVTIAITPTWSNSWFPLYSIVKEDTATFMAGLFTIISLVIIVWKQFGQGGKSK